MTALVDRYLAELGLERPAADAAGLAALHAAHVHRFAHDTIWISRGRVPELDAEAFAEALVAGEGGGCIQLTGGFAWLLEQLGFEVELHGARVQRPFDRAPGGIGQSASPRVCRHVAVKSHAPGRLAGDALRRSGHPRTGPRAGSSVMGADPECRASTVCR